MRGLSALLSSLDVSIEDSFLRPLIERVKGELKGIGLRHFSPVFYVGDEWFSPEGSPAVAVPFYLLREDLFQLEKKMMHQVEGASPYGALKLLRHELGHAFDHAYGIGKRKDFVAAFGSPKQSYKKEVALSPYHPDFIHHLDATYGQTHPSEDFAETFAYYLARGGEIESLLEGKSAVLAGKFLYVKKMVSELKGQKPRKILKREPRFYNIKCLHYSLKTHYKRRIKEEGVMHLARFDSKLARLFKKNKENKAARGAGFYLKSQRKHVMAYAKKNYNIKTYQLEPYYKCLTKRAYQLDLFVDPKNPPGREKIALYVIKSLQQASSC